MPGVIVPRKAVSEIQKLLEDGESEVTIELSATKIRVATADVVLTSKLIDGTFPDYQRVIPAGNDKRLIVDRGEGEFRNAGGQSAPFFDAHPDLLHKFLPISRSLFTFAQLAI